MRDENSFKKIVKLMRNALSREPMSETDILEIFNLSKKDLKCLIKEMREVYGVEVSSIKGKSNEIYYYIDPLRKYNSREDPYVIVVPNPVRVGIISDTHLGSKADMVKELHDFYNQTKNIVDFYLHAGDVIDGMNIYHGHIYNIKSDAIGLKNQIAYLEKTYPYVDKPTYFIRGNHDQDKHNKDINPYLMLSSRSDLVYIGDYYKDLLFVDKENKKNKLKVALVHGDGGGSYAVSYKAQAYIRGTHPKDRADLYIFGHWHKAGLFWYEGCLMYLAGCFQKDTDYMVRKGLAGDRVGTVMEIHFYKRTILNIKYEMFKY